MSFCLFKTMLIYVLTSGILDASERAVCFRLVALELHFATDTNFHGPVLCITHDIFLFFIIKVRVNFGYWSVYSVLWSSLSEYGYIEEK
jgi:hypothetical protein